MGVSLFRLSKVWAGQMAGVVVVVTRNGGLTSLYREPVSEHKHHGRHGSTRSAGKPKAEHHEHGKATAKLRPPPPVRKLQSSRCRARSLA